MEKAACFGWFRCCRCDGNGWHVSIGTRARILRHEPTYQMSRAHVSYDTNPPQWSPRRRRADAQQVAGHSVGAALMALPARAIKTKRRTMKNGVETTKIAIGNVDNFQKVPWKMCANPQKVPWKMCANRQKVPWKTCAGSRKVP